MDLINRCITFARHHNCSDIHLTSGEKVLFRHIGILQDMDFPADPQEVEAMILSLLSADQKKKLDTGKELDFSYIHPDSGRQRVNVYRARNVLCCAIRILSKNISTLEELYLPKILNKLMLLPRGLILVTGPTGSGKSTTLAAMVEMINQNRPTHIITIEDPIEYTYENKKALIHQREVGEDTASFATALRAALREDPDVILVGEMRDYETVSAVLTAAETGHLVLSTLHTTGAVNTVDRIIDIFPEEGQQQVRTQLSSVLQATISQRLVSRADREDRIAAMEIMVGTDATRNLIRDDKCHQLRSLLETGARDGMQTLPQDLARLIREKIITYETALSVCDNEQELLAYVSPIRY